jgi:hypothetical protein
MSPKRPTRKRPAPDITPDSLPGKETDRRPEVSRDGERRGESPDMTPDSLPRRERELPERE